MTWVDPVSGAVFTHNPGVDPESCEHVWEPYPSGLIVVSDEEFYADPLRMDFGPSRWVDCQRCGAPVDRGRYSQVISIPALREDWP